MTAATELPDGPDVIGPAPPMPTKAEAEAAWRRAYVARMVERGIDREDAVACSEATDADLIFDPAQAADDELWYWSQDGD